MLRKDVLPAWADRPLASVRKRDVIELVERVHARAPGGRQPALEFAPAVLQVGRRGAT